MLTDCVFGRATGLPSARWQAGAAADQISVLIAAIARPRAALNEYWSLLGHTTIREAVSRANDRVQRTSLRTLGDCCPRQGGIARRDSLRAVGRLALQRL